MQPHYCEKWSQWLASYIATHEHHQTWTHRFFSPHRYIDFFSCYVSMVKITQCVRYGCSSKRARRSKCTFQLLRMKGYIFSDDVYSIFECYLKMCLHHVFRTINNEMKTSGGKNAVKCKFEFCKSQLLRYWDNIRRMVDAASKVCSLWGSHYFIQKFRCQKKKKKALLTMFFIEKKTGR